MTARHLAAGLVAAAAALVGPAAAQAETNTVYAGPPVAKAKALPPGAVGNAFYPRNVAVRAGGKVAFEIGGLHNVVFAPKGAPFGPFHAPDPARPVSGVQDPAGAEMANHGNGFVGTGLLDADARTSFPASKAVRFTRPGTYRFICTVHGPAMGGSIVVS